MCTVDAKEIFDKPLKKERLSNQEFQVIKRVIKSDLPRHVKFRLHVLHCWFWNFSVTLDHCRV